MITEDYVSFETAELLKEKGFDVPCTGRYSVRSKEFHLDSTRLCNNGGLFEYAAPSQSMARKWLREVHNIFFNVNYFHIDVGNKWAHLTIWLPYKNGCEYSVEGFDIETIYEAAIKYCLENLI